VADQMVPMSVRATPTAIQKPNASRKRKYDATNVHT